MFRLTGAAALASIAAASDYGFGVDLGGLHGGRSLGHVGITGVHGNHYDDGFHHLRSSKHGKHGKKHGLSLGGYGGHGGHHGGFDSYGAGKTIIHHNSYGPPKNTFSSYGGHHGHSSKKVYSLGSRDHGDYGYGHK